MNLLRLTLINGVGVSVLVLKISRLTVFFSSKIFFPVISCILRVRINKTSEAFSKSSSIETYVIGNHENRPQSVSNEHPQHRFS